MTDPNLVPGG